MIVWLASYPRSGNSLARLLLGSCFRARSGSVYPTAESPDLESVRQFLGEPTAFDLAEAHSHPEPFFVKTHEFPADDLPAIYIVRDGRDALVSYAHFVLAPERTGRSPAIRKELLDVLEQLIVTDRYFGGWSAHVRAWTHRSAPTAIVRYEDLLREGSAVLERSLRQLGTGIPCRSGEAIPPFQQLHARFPWFFRTGKIGSWRDDMGPRLERAFWERHGDVMLEFGYLREDPTPAGSDEEALARLRSLEASEAARSELADQVNRAEDEIADLRLAANRRLELLRASDSECRNMKEIAEERLRQLNASAAECRSLQQVADQRLHQLNASAAECQDLREIAEERLCLIETLTGEIESLREALSAATGEQPHLPTLARTAAAQ